MATKTINEVDFTEKTLSMTCLRQMSLQECAEYLELSVYQIELLYTFRKKHKISIKKLLSNFKKYNDTEMARILGINNIQYKRIREQLGIRHVRTHTKKTNTLANVWTIENLELLGKDYDKNIAKDLDIPIQYVYDQRTRLGIPAFGLKWKDSYMPLLGTMSDNNLSKILNISREYIRQKRDQYGIPIYEKPEREWTEEEISELGKITDKEVSEKYDISLQKVNKIRRLLGIQTVCESKWSEEIISKLGTVTDREIAEKLGVNIFTVQRKRKELGIKPLNSQDGSWIDEEIFELLGNVSDAFLAAKYDVSVGSIRNLRIKHDIQSYKSHCRSKKGVFSNQEHVKLLGTMSDYKVAKIIGCSATYVCIERNKRKIPSFRSTSKDSNNEKQ